MDKAESQAEFATSLSTEQENPLQDLCVGMMPAY